MANCYLKIYEKDKTIERHRTKKTRRIFNLVRRVKKSELTRFYIKVTYGRAKDCNGKMATFYNDGFYTTKKGLLFAFRCFIGKDLIEEFH